MNRTSERETVVELPFAADCYPCVEKLRTVLPFTGGLRDGAVQLVLTHHRVAYQRVVPVCEEARVDAATRVRFKFQSNLVWDSIKSISNFCFQF